MEASLSQSIAEPNVFRLSLNDNDRPEKEEPGIASLASIIQHVEEEKEEIVRNE